VLQQTVVIFLSFCNVTRTFFICFLLPFHYNFSNIYPFAILIHFQFFISTTFKKKQEEGEIVHFIPLQEKNEKTFKVEEILKDSLNAISSPSLKIQIMGGKIFLRCKDETLLGAVNKLLEIKTLLTQQCFALLLQANPPIT